MKKVLRIKQFIGAKCLTQREAAKICGLSPQAFSRIVAGREAPFSKRGPHIAEALGWEDDWEKLFEEVEV